MQEVDRVDKVNCMCKAYRAYPFTPRGYGVKGYQLHGLLTMLIERCMYGGKQGRFIFISCKAPTDLLCIKVDRLVIIAKLALQGLVIIAKRALQEVDRVDKSALQDFIGLSSDWKSDKRSDKWSDDARHNALLFF